MVARSVDAARKLIARSLTFQTRINTHHGGGATEANALNHVYYFDAFTWGIDNLRPKRPMAIIADNDAQWFKIYPACARVNLSLAGSVAVVITDNARFTATNPNTTPPGTDDTRDSYIDFLNFWGGVIDDQDGKFNADGFDEYGFDEIEVFENPWRPLANQRTDDHWIASVLFTHQGAGGRR